ncbi:hypothetical protein ACHAXA_000654 [Cyclostephanos tholiformis]|uniref:Uncharacterized protein n=1 Tax=Cyclostephanos tholiformis TaxID=382380 RepID=A0ABD3SCG3_9STRA
MVPYRPSFDDKSYDAQTKRGYDARPKREERAAPLPERLRRERAAYRTTFDDDRDDDPPKRSHDAQAGREELVFSLTERLREGESEIRLLRQENWELQDRLRQVNARGGTRPIDLDVASAYEDLLAHLKQREADFRSESMKQKERQRDLEKEIRKLKDKSSEARKLLDDQEKYISSMEKERERHISLIKRDADSDLKKMQRQLDAAMNDNKEMHLQISELHTETVNGKQREMEDREKLAQLLKRIDNHIRDQDDLERINEDLLNRLETQRRLLCEKDDEIMYIERSHNERENILNDDLDRMRNRLNAIAEIHEKTLNDHEDMIRLLYKQIDRYQVIIDEGNYVTTEQRNSLLAKNQEIKSLSKSIERAENSGFLSQLDNLFMCGPSLKGNESAYTSAR